MISPKNYFLFTPLLPSVAVGTLSPRSIIQPTRYITRHKTREVSVIEADAKEVDVCPLSWRDAITCSSQCSLHFSPSRRRSLSLVSGPIHASPCDIIETITFRHLGNQGESVVDDHPVRLSRVCRWCRGPDFRYSWREGEGLFYERIGRCRTGTHGYCPLCISS